MREIKFRAWHKEKNLMGEVALYLFGVEIIHVSLKTDYKSWRVRETKLMQFTGLQDCNGVDIYEGDIVRIAGLRLGIKGIMLKPVVFKFGNFGFETNKTDKWEDFLTLYDYFDFLKYHNFDLDFKVIGNIYENPELLEV